MTQSANAVVNSQIVVEAPIERAFSVFTERFGDFKPPEHNLLGSAIAETVFEPHVGGHIFDRGTDGSECRWARVLVYEPPDRVVFSWDISPQWQVETEPDNTTRLGPSRLTHPSGARAPKIDPTAVAGTPPGGKETRGRPYARPPPSPTRQPPPPTPHHRKNPLPPQPPPPPPPPTRRNRAHTPREHPAPPPIHPPPARPPPRVESTTHPR